MVINKDFFVIIVLTDVVFGFENDDYYFSKKNSYADYSIFHMQQSPDFNYYEI